MAAEGSSPTPTPEQEMEDMERAAALQRAIDTLPRRQREVLQLRWHNQLSYVEVGALLQSLRRRSRFTWPAHLNICAKPCRGSSSNLAPPAQSLPPGLRSGSSSCLSRAQAAALRAREAAESGSSSCSSSISPSRRLRQPLLHRRPLDRGAFTEQIAVQEFPSHVSPYSPPQPPATRITVVALSPGPGPGRQTSFPFACRDFALDGCTRYVEALLPHHSHRGKSPHERNGVGASGPLLGGRVHPGGTRPRGALDGGSAPESTTCRAAGRRDCDVSGTPSARGAEINRAPARRAAEEFFTCRPPAALLSSKQRLS